MSFSLRGQLSALRKRYKNGQGKIVKCKNGIRLEWRQILQPSKLSRKYLVSIRWYGLEDIPEVEILSPVLKEVAGGKRSPHEFYSETNTKPCLLFNKGNIKDWTPKMEISESIVPWTLEWLWYWELWLVDGEWRGGGVHPGELTIEEYMAHLATPQFKSRGEKQ